MLRVNVGGAQRLVRAFGAGMVERRRGDLVFVTSDVVAHPRPRMSAYVASKWGLEGFVTALQMELEGTGVRAVIVRPGPDADRHGHGLGPRRHRRGAGRVDALGPGPPLGLPAPRGRGVGHRPRRGRAAGHAPQRRRGPARGAAWREPPKERSTSDDDDRDCASRRGCRAARARTATSTSSAATPSGSWHGCGPSAATSGEFTLGRPRRRAADRGRRQRVLLPGPRGAARPGRGLPVHDADLRQGRGLRRPARAPARDAAQPGAARQVHAGPRRDHRARGRADGGRLGRRGRDRPARLVRRADHLHVLGLPHRAALPRRARRALRPALPRPRAGHRPHRLRRPLRGHRELPPPRRGPGGAGRAGQGIMDRRAAGPPAARRRGATCSTS